MSFTIGHHRHDAYDQARSALWPFRHKRMDPAPRAKPTCDNCQAAMEPEHAHHRCSECGYVAPCCEGEPC